MIRGTVTFGDLKGQPIGLGPVVSNTTEVGTHDTIVELEWLHAVDTRNRIRSTA